MPWRHLTIAKQCNTCRRPLAVGAYAYQGDVTGAHWCESCANEHGERPNKPAQTGMTALQDMLAAFRAKHQRRDVSARMIGDRDE